MVNPVSGIKRSLSIDSTDATSSVKQSRPTPTNLADVPNEMLVGVTQYLPARDRRPFIEGVFVKPTGEWARPPLEELSAADGVFAVRAAGGAPEALQALRDQWDGIASVFRHEPLMALLNRCAAEHGHLIGAELRDLHAGVRELCATLPAHRRAKLEWLMAAMAPEELMFTSLEQAGEHARRLRRIPESPLRALAQCHAMEHSVILGCEHIGANRDAEEETSARVEQVLVDCMRPGSPPTDADHATGPHRAAVLRHALEAIFQWNIDDMPPLRRATGALLDEIARLDPADRHLARIEDAEEHSDALLSLLQSAETADAMPMYEQLRNAAPRHGAGTHLADMTVLVQQLPHERVGGEVAELAARAAALPAPDMPETVLLNLAATDIFNRMPQEQRPAALQALVQAARALENRQVIEPASLAEILNEVRRLLPLAPADAQPALEQLLAVTGQP